MADAIRLSYQSPLLLPFRPSLHTPKLSLAPLKQQNPDSRRISTVPDAASFACNHRLRLSSFKVHATVTEKNDQPKWWERNAGPNMIDIHSTEEFLSALSQAGDRLVIVEFYGTWCGSCRALFPKLCKTAEDHPDILFLKVNFDENKPMCKGLNVKVLPYFHFYRGADGQLESFSCSLAKLSYRCGQPEKPSCETISVYTGDAYNFENKKFQKIKDAIETHNTARCSIGPPVGVGDINLGVSNPADKPAEASSR